MTPPAVARITVRPSGIEFQVGAGETVMAAAERHGVRWPTTCHGIAVCRTCLMYVLDDDLTSVAAPTALELQALASAPLPLNGDRERWRLACQTTIRAAIGADVTVRKPGVTSTAG